MLLTQCQSTWLPSCESSNTSTALLHISSLIVERSLHCQDTLIWTGLVTQQHQDLPLDSSSISEVVLLAGLQNDSLLSPSLHVKLNIEVKPKPQRRQSGYDNS